MLLRSSVLALSLLAGLERRTAHRPSHGLSKRLVVDSTSTERLQEQETDATITAVC